MEGHSKFLNFWPKQAGRLIPPRCGSMYGSCLILNSPKPPKKCKHTKYFLTKSDELTLDTVTHSIVRSHLNVIRHVLYQIADVHHFDRYVNVDNLIEF